MKKIPTTVLLTFISVADLIWGSHGIVTVILWICYGIFWYHKHFWD